MRLHNNSIGEMSPVRASLVLVVTLGALVMSPNALADDNFRAEDHYLDTAVADINDRAHDDLKACKTEHALDPQTVPVYMDRPGKNLKVHFVYQPGQGFISKTRAKLPRYDRRTKFYGIVDGERTNMKTTKTSQAVVTELRLPKYVDVSPTERELNQMAANCPTR